LSAAEEYGTSADDLLDAAAQLGARHWRSLVRRGYQAGVLSSLSELFFPKQQSACA
jgi:hypothetical protein